MRISAGFSFVETIVATAILATTSIGIATMASSSLKSSSINQHRMIAAVLVEHRLETMRSLRISNIQWTAGGSLDVISPAADYFDYAGIAGDHTIIQSSSDSSLPYPRLWRIDGVRPRVLTVIVSDNRHKPEAVPAVLARGTITASSKW